MITTEISEIDTSYNSSDLSSKEVSSSSDKYETKKNKGILKKQN